MNVRKTAAAGVVAAALALNGCTGSQPAATFVPATATGGAASQLPTTAPTATPTSVVSPAPVEIGSSWTWRETGLDGLAVSRAPSGGWVMVGSAAAPGQPDGHHVPAAWTSADGSAWVRADVMLGPGTIGGSLELVTPGDPQTFAAGSVAVAGHEDHVDVAVWTFSNGSWFPSSGGTPLDLGPCIEGCPRLTSIASGSRGEVLTGYRITTDGDLKVVVWKGADFSIEVPLPPGGPGTRIAAEMSVMAMRVGYLIAGAICSADGRSCRAVTWTSTHGTSWDGPTDLPGGAGCRALRAVSYGAQIVVLGQRCTEGCTLTAWSSTDGAHWWTGDLELARLTSPETGLITSAGRQFLVIGSRAGAVEVWRSTNGAQWQQLQLSGGPLPPVDELLFYDLAGLPAAAIAVGVGPSEAKGVWTSP